MSNFNLPICILQAISLLFQKFQYWIRLEIRSICILGIQDLDRIESGFYKYLKVFEPVKDKNPDLIYYFEPLSGLFSKNSEFLRNIQSWNYSSWDNPSWDNQVEIFPLLNSCVHILLSNRCVHICPGRGKIFCILVHESSWTFIKKFNSK